VTDHERIEELLAGYALRSLSGADAAAAEQALSEHVPGCEDCRRTLTAFDAVAGDLALSITPEAPPELLLARLHREMEPRRGPVRSWNPGRLVAVAASVVLVVAVTGLVVSRGGGVASAELVATDLQTAVAAAERPDAQTEQDGATTEVMVPDGFYLYGQDVPAPPPGQVYRLWLRSDDADHFVGDFRPDVTGTVAIRVLVDGSFDEIVVTVEDAAAAPSTPGAPAWESPAPAA
jgi:hypothetical protein